MARNGNVFSDMASFSRASGWDLHFRQLESGPEKIQVSCWETSHISILDVRFRRAYHQRGLGPENSYAFGLAMTSVKDWQGHTTPHNSLLNFNSTAGLDCVSEAEFHGMTVAIEKSFLQEIAADMQLHLPDYAIVDPVIIRPSLNTALLRLAVRLRTERGCEFDAETSFTADFLQLTSESEASAAREHFSRRAKAVSKALRFIEEHEDPVLQIGTICKETGIAWRTLDRGFKERFDISPKAYLLKRRLSEVQSLLRQASPGQAKVNELAARQGFWHMGQFARDYKRLFGELPTATLARKAVPVLSVSPKT